MKKIFCFVLLFLLCVITKAYADKWQTVGARAMGMGGVGVAVAYGTDAQYYNPALLATQNDKQHENNITLNLNVGIETTEKVLTAIDKLTKIAKEYDSVKDEIYKDGTLNPKQTDSVFETLSLLKDLSQNNSGATVHANTGIAAKLKKISVSARSYLYCGITPIVDIKNISLMADPSSPATTTKLIGLDDTSAVPSDYQNYVDRLLAMFKKYGLTQNHIYGFTGYNYTPEELARAIINMVMGSGTTGNIEEMTETIEETIPDIIDILNQDDPGSYTENETQAVVDAGVFTEVAIGYGHEVYRGIQIGGNLKFIQGQLAETGFLILPCEDTIEDTIKDSLKETEISNQFGIDLGVLLDISKFTDREILFAPKIGVSARNINNPSFDRPSKPSDEKYSKIHWNSNSYDLERQIRAGIAINPLKNLIFALDIDILSNNTFVKKFDSQDFALGLEYSLFNKRSFSLPLRVGFNKNVANSKCATEYTFGFGIHTFGFCMEFAGGVSGNNTTVDNQKVPSTASFAFNLGYTF